MAMFGRPTREDERKAQAYAQWVQQRNPLAILSLVLGVFSLADFGVLIVPELASIVLGIIALKQLARVKPSEVDAKPRGHRLAWSGIALSLISLIIATVLYLQRRGHS